MSSLQTMRFVGTVLECSFYGLHCVIFTVRACIGGKKRSSGTNITIYPLSLLFILCTIFCVLDIVQTVFIHRFKTTQDPHANLVSYNINIVNTAMYCAITFIAQGVLIYRCWLVWGRKLLVIGIPLILVWVSFGTSLAMLGALVEPPSSRAPDTARSWFYPLATAAFSISLAVNAIVAILLAIKAFLFLREARQNFTVHKRRVYLICQIIFFLNESAMLMLGSQVIWLILFCLRSPAFFLFRGSIVMIYGLTPTLIPQRISQPTGQISENSTEATPKATTIRFAV